jgi:hypothetical protein
VSKIYKRCRSCGDLKELSQFHRAGDGYRRGICAACRSEQRAKPTNEALLERAAVSL